MARAIQILYFAWVRERLGIAEERVVLPDDIHSVSDLLMWLKDRNDVYQQIFADPSRLRFALDQDFVELIAPLGDAAELAVFPPVTGG